MCIIYTLQKIVKNNKEYNFVNFITVTSVILVAEP